MTVLSSLFTQSAFHHYHLNWSSSLCSRDSPLFILNRIYLPPPQTTYEVSSPTLISLRQIVDCLDPDLEWKVDSPVFWRSGSIWCHERTCVSLSRRFQVWPLDRPQATVLPGLWHCRSGSLANWGHRFYIFPLLLSDLMPHFCLGKE